VSSSAFHSSGSGRQPYFTDGGRAIFINNMEMVGITKREMKLTILRIVATYQGASVNKYNFLGRTAYEGDLCREFKRAPTKSEKQLAGRAWDELVASAHLEIDYGQLVREGANCFLTDKGRYALARGGLDEMDLALQGLNPHLVQLRDGFHEALLSHAANSVQQAANSGREFINQTLRYLSPEEEVVKRDWFKQDANSRNRLKVNLTHKISFALERGGIVDEDDREFCQVALKHANKALQGGAHAPTEPQRLKIRDAMEKVEMAFRIMFKIGQSSL
jgi:hypothetical protein